MTRLAPALRDVPDLVRTLRADLRGHDLMLDAAGLAFYAGLAAVPLLLVGLDLAGLVLGDATVERLGRTLADRAPQSLGFDDQLRRLADLGASLGLVSLVAAVLVGSTYGEGLLRAFDRLSPAPDRPARALLGRLRAVALLAVLPLVVIAGLVTTAAIVRGVGEGVGATVLGAYLAFVVGWLVSSAVLVLVYRTFAPERPGRRALVWGSLAAGSFLTGMSEGWVLLLSLDLDLGRAYGGSTGIAAAAAFLVWLFLVQYVLLVGLLLVRRLTVLFGR